MKVITWNEKSTWRQLFNDIKIKPDNNGNFNPDSFAWIKLVTDDFGKDDISIIQNLLTYFQDKVEYLTCYHASRFIYPKKILEEGLEKLSPCLIFKICIQAGEGSLLNRATKTEIIRNFNSHINQTTGSRRTYIYLQVDKYLDMFDENTDQIDPSCSFFNGSEALPHILGDTTISEKVISAIQKGSPTVVTVLLPFNEEFLEIDCMKRIALHFFALWFNNIILNQVCFRYHIGLNINRNIDQKFIFKIDY